MERVIIRRLLRGRVKSCFGRGGQVCVNRWFGWPSWEFGRFIRGCLHARVDFTCVRNCPFSSGPRILFSLSCVHIVCLAFIPSFLLVWAAQMEKRSVNVVWMHLSLLFPYSPFRNLERKEECGLALKVRFSWHNRATIVPSLPVPPRPALFIFWSSQKPLFIWLHSWPTFSSFSHIPSPRSKGLRSISLTAFLEMKKKRSKPHNPGPVVGPRGGFCRHLLASTRPSANTHHPQPSALLSPRAVPGDPQSPTPLSPCSQRFCLLWGHMLVCGPGEMASAGQASVPSSSFSVDEDTCTCSAEPRRCKLWHTK